jgi:hypothetical protein
MVTKDSRYWMNKVQEPRNSDHIVELCNLNSYNISQIGNLTNIEAIATFSRCSHILFCQFTFMLRKGRGRFVYYYKNIHYVLHFTFHSYHYFYLSFISRVSVTLATFCAGYGSFNFRPNHSIEVP